MWLWLLIPVLLCADLRVGSASPLPLPPEAQGPLSKEEANLLWEEGSRAVVDTHWSQATLKLKRLTERYPAHPRTLQSHALLGRALLRGGRPESALKPLRHYIEALGQTAEAHRARLLLAEAYLQLKRPTEARAVTQETQQAEARARLAPELGASARLLDAQASVALGHLEQAEQLLAEALKRLPADSENLQSQAQRTALEIRMAKCGRLSISGAALNDEGQASSVMTRRGDCLAEALPHLRNVLRIDSPESRERGDWKAAVRTAEAAYADYRKVCGNPGQPQGKRTRKEREQYLSELRTLLVRTCTEAIGRNLAILNSWKNDIPSQSRAELAQVRAACEIAGRF